MNYKFSDLIEVAKVQRLNDLFHAATGIPGAVIDLQGTIITCSGWQDVCTKFHRVNAETVQQCVESDTVFANQVGVGQKYTVYTCGSGLVVAASPIAIGGEHVANFITSQFLFQPPDRNSFLKQAKRFGFDETAYMEAVGKIPVIDEVRLQPFLEYFSEFAAMLGEMGLKQLRQLEAAAALKDSEQRWATTLSSIGDAVIATDTHGRITFMNGVAEKLTGWALAEAAAKPVTDVFNIIDERTRRAVDNPVRRVLQKGMIVGLANHTLLLSRDGREIPIDDSAAPIRDRTGYTKGVVLVFRDITERRRAEKELLRAKEEWEFTFDSMPDMIAIIDAEHRTLRVNEAMARRLGRKAEECVGLHCYETVHGLSAPPSFCPHSRSLRDGSQHTEEITEDRLGGGCFLVSTTPLQVPGGHIMRTVHVARDITERKAAEEALRESQTRMNRAQEIAHLGSWELDLMSNRLSWSDEVYRIFGLQPQEFSATYNAFLEAVHPEDREAVDAAYSGSLREGRDTYEIEHRVVRRSSGEIRIVHEKCEHFRDDSGRIVKSVGMVHDITERKRAEQELREARLELERKVAERTAELRRSETYLSEAQRLSHTGSWAFDLASGKFVYASAECIRMYEHDAQEGLPTREATFRLIHPEDRDSVQGGFEKSLREKVDTSSEFRLVLSSGTVKHVQTIRHPVLNEVGDVVELVGTTIDITERKRAEAALRMAGIYNRSLIEASLDPLVTIDPEGRISDVNAATEKATGHTRSELIGTEFSDYFTEPERARAGYRQVFHHGFVRDYELEIRNRNGKITPVLYNASVYRDDTGNVIGVFAAARDITEQKRAEEARSKLAAIVESSDDAIISKDLNGTIMSWNQGAERLYGYSAAEALGRPVTILMPLGQQDQFAVFMRQIREGIRIEHYETERVRKDGRTIDVSLSLSPVRDHQDRIIGASAIARDITAQKRAEEALRRSEAVLAEAQRLSHTGSWVWDPSQRKFLHASEEMLRLYGFDSHKGIPTPDQVLERIHPDDRDKIMRTRAGNASVDFDYKFVLPDGTLKHFHCIAHPVLGPSGEVHEVMGIAMDITDRKRAEETLRLAGAYNRSLIEASLDPLVTIDPEGRISDVNAATEQVTGYNRSELIGTDFSDYFTDPEKARRGYRQVFTEGLVRDYELSIRHRDGRITPVLYNASVYRDEAGKVIGVFAAARDITERKETLRFFQNMDRINRAMQGTNDLEQMMSDILDAMLSIFDCDRVFLVYPWDPDSEYEAVIERPGPGYQALGLVPMNPDIVRSVLGIGSSGKAVTVGPGCDDPLEMPSGIKSLIGVALYPKSGKPWALGMHQCSYPRVWNQEEKSLVEEIARRMGDVLTSLLAYRDLHERGAEINRLKNYLSNIIDSMPSVLVGMDNTRTVTQWNRQAETFTGIPAGEAIGKPMAHLLPEFAAWIMNMGNDMNEHRFSSLEKLLIERKGERRLYDLMLYPILSDTAEGAVLRIEDVTERVRIQELIVQTEKLMSIGGLAAGMAHEINNPLGIITQAAQNIERRISLELPANRKVSEELGLDLEGIRAYLDKRQISDFLASIRTASSRAATIIGNILQFSRRSDMTPQPASISQVVDQALELAASDYDLKKKYDFRSIDIIKEYQDIPDVTMIPVEIEQVILNLLKNAAQAMTANPPDRKPGITLRIGRDDRYAVLEVEDNGPGMTEDIRRRVFEPFFTTKEPGVGTGLGLSVSYMIVTQNHKGLMEVQSTVGRGSVFKVRLPIGWNEPE